MDWIALLLGLADKLVGMLADKLRDQYNAKLLQLRTDYYAERNKPESLRDFALIDNLEFEIGITVTALMNQKELNK